MILPVNQIICGDCREVIKSFPAGSIDLVFGSPPYEDCRTYGINFKLKGQDWVDWMVEIYSQSLRVCHGLVAFVVEGKTKNYKWSATPMLLAADLHRAGFNLRKPPLYRREGIPGSGGPDWLSNKYENIICVTQPGKLPWSENTAMGHKPKYEQGGMCSNRHADGRRSNIQRYGKNGLKPYAKPERANPGNIINCETKKTSIRSTRKASRNRKADGTREVRSYFEPNISNPGNIINCGSGHLGDDLAYENEAPFPEKLAEFFIKSFCKPGGIVLDPFIGSGTVAAVAYKNHRNYIGIDLRQSQVDLTNKRLTKLKENFALLEQ